MEKENKNCKRIIFQPTKENSEKITRIAETSGVSVSRLMNLLIETLDEDAKVSIQLINNKNDNKTKSEPIN